MGDAGEGLIDAESRIAERIEEVEQARRERRAAEVRDPEREQARESLRLARAELQRQLDATTHERRRAGLADAIGEIERRMAALDVPPPAPPPPVEVRRPPASKPRAGKAGSARKGR